MLKLLTYIRHMGRMIDGLLQFRRTITYADLPKAQRGLKALQLRSVIRSLPSRSIPVVPDNKQYNLFAIIVVSPSTHTLTQQAESFYMFFSSMHATQLILALSSWQFSVTLLSCKLIDTPIIS